MKILVKPDRIALPKDLINEKTLKGSLQLSLRDGKRSLALWSEDADYLYVPRHWATPEELLELGRVEVEDLPDFTPLPPNIRPRFQLRRPTSQNPTDQVAMWKALVEGGSGLGVLRCGGGKTVIGLHSAVSVGYATLIVVPDTGLMDQWRERIFEHLEIAEDQVGVIRGDKMQWDRPFVLASIQTLWRRVEEGLIPEEARNHWGTVIYDEAHTLGAEKFNKTADLGKGVRWGLTATIERPDGMSYAFESHLGPVLYADLEQAVEPVVVFLKSDRRLSAQEHRDAADKRGDFSASRYVNTLVDNRKRNEHIGALVRTCLDSGRETMVLTPSRKHLDVDLVQLLEDLEPEVINADTAMKGRAHLIERAQLILSITKLAHQGLDKPTLGAIILCAPFQQAPALQQLLGRLQRYKRGKPWPFLFVVYDPEERHSRRWAQSMRSLLGLAQISFTTRELGDLDQVYEHGAWDAEID